LLWYADADEAAAPVAVPAVSAIAAAPMAPVDLGPDGPIQDPN